MAEEDVDVSRFRHEHESSAEWGIRKSFLEAHIDKFDETRLVCLSSCFINVEFYGCSYPPGVMEQLRILKEDIQDAVDEFQATVKARTEVKFVKAEEKSNSKGTQKTKSTVKTNKLLTPLAFVKSGSSLGSEKEQPIDVDRNMEVQAGGMNKCINKLSETVSSIKAPPKNTRKTNKNDHVTVPAFFAQLGHTIKSLEHLGKSRIETLHMACQKCQLSIECGFDKIKNAKVHEFVCKVLINSQIVASDSGLSKKLAKHNAFSKATVNISENKLQSTSSHSLQSDIHQGFDRSNSMNSPAALKAKNRKRNASPQNIQNFYIIEHLSGRLNATALQILQHSADFNKVPITYDFRPAGALGERCECILMGQVLADVISDDGTNAKLKVAERALEKLRKSNFTVIVKQSVDADDEKLSKTEVVGEEGTKAVSSIPDSNIGNKLLKMMGWKGGGLGSEGNKGIAEPVSVSGVVNREGLGLQADKGISSSFLPKVKQVINEFLRSDREDDLAFSPDFLKDERALIHKEAQKLGLKTQSYGSGDDRYIVLRRKRNASELVMRIMREGGETHKYKLIGPGEHPGLQQGGEGKQWAFMGNDESAPMIVDSEEDDDGTGLGLGFSM